MYFSFFKNLKQSSIYKNLIYQRLTQLIIRIHILTEQMKILIIIYRMKGKFELELRTLNHQFPEFKVSKPNFESFTRTNNPHSRFEQVLPTEQIFLIPQRRGFQKAYMIIVFVRVLQMYNRYMQCFVEMIY